MSRLTHRDYRAMLNCVGEIYAHHDPANFGPRVLALIHEIIPAGHAVYNELDQRNPRPAYVTHPAGINLGENEHTTPLVLREHPLVNHYRRTRDGSARTISDFLTRRQFHETAIYREFFRGIGVEFMVCLWLPDRGANSAALAFARDRRPFSERERLMLNLLRPHLFQAHRNAETIQQLRDEAALTARAVDACARGVVTLDAKGAVRLCSARARQWLTLYFGNSRAPDSLPDTVRRWTRHQQSLATNANHLPGERGPLVVERDGHQLSIRLLADSVAGQQTLVLEERRTELSAAPLQSLGLTAREAEVLLWVAQGKTNPEIGTILGLSPGTVHKHTEHIFEKLGVETRTAAAARAWETLGAEDA